MPGSNIFLPRRIANTLREIYRHKITAICAPNGTGKSSLLREFARRSRPEGVSLRFVRSAKSSGECFAEIARLITGEPLDEPLTDREFAELNRKFSAAKPDKQLVIIVDCAAACDTLFGNLRTVKLLLNCPCANFAFVCTSLKFGYRALAENKGILLIERDSLCMDLAETEQFSGRFGADVDPAEIYKASGGNFLNAAACLILAQQGQDFAELTSKKRMIRALFGDENSRFSPESLRLQGALIASATFPVMSEDFCRDLSSFGSLNDYFGEGLFTPENILAENDRLNEILPLIQINRRTREVAIHPMLMRTAYTLFFMYPENIRHDMRICFAKEFLRRGQNFFCFCEYFLAGEYELAAEVRNRGTISYSMLIKSRQLMQRFVEGCPMDYKPIMPRLLRITALLMHTDAKTLLAGKFPEMIAHIAAAPGYDSAERKSMTCYAYALRTNENFYDLDKMGSNIKRAYDLFKSGQLYLSPTFPWTLYAPSVFCLLHKRGYSLQAENDRFTRYQRMYTEMLGHGRYAQLVFTGEMKYYQGDLSGGLELLSAAASRCTDKSDTAMKLSALYSAAKCCMHLGEYLRFFELLDELRRIERAYVGREEGDCARLCLGLLCSMRGGMDDIWFALTAEETDTIYNRYTAPYFAMTRAVFQLMYKDYETLTACRESYLAAAENAGNEAAGIKLRLFEAQAYLALGDHETAIQLFCEAIDLGRENFITTVAAEHFAMFPELFRQLRPLAPERVQREADLAAEMGTEFRRGVEAVRTYELSYLSNSHPENHAEHYLVPLERLICSTEELQKSLGLTTAAYSYAILAASGSSNAEISAMLDVTEDSVKSSLKRTCAAVGAKNRRDLVNVVPTLK